MAPGSPRSPRSARWLALASGLFILAGFAMLALRQPVPVPDAPMDEIQVVLKGQAYTVEVARTPAQRRAGLMHRPSLAPDRGMLFVGDRTQDMRFWMKNTRIALDILFFDERFRLVDMHENVPPCLADPCPLYPSRAPARHVLELNAGQARALGLALGDRLEIPGRELAP